MKINGIITEYNPFHNGHAYQLSHTKELTGADYTIVVMSGDFVQRGIPALLDKHTRAKMALSSGADLVLELPVLFATSSAEFFATGAVNLLEKLGIVTHLSFGSECGDINILTKAAEILLKEPSAYTKSLKENLKQGMSYPTARNWALVEHYPEMQTAIDIFKSPNNILGMEYIKALLRAGSDIQPVTLLRSGSAYNARKPEDGFYCSALSIREALSSGSDLAFLKDQMPASAHALLMAQYLDGRVLFPNSVSELLYYKLLSEESNGYEKYLDVSEDLSNRIRKSLPDYGGFEDFCLKLKTKEMTYTRISRCLLHILLKITKEDMACSKELGFTPYARILGFKKEAAPLLAAIKEQAAIPLVSKLADASQILNEDAMLMLKKDIFAAQVYHGLIAGKVGGAVENEYRISPVVV